MLASLPMRIASSFTRTKLDLLDGARERPSEWKWKCWAERGGGRRRDLTEGWMEVQSSGGEVDCGAVCFEWEVEKGEEA